jgi:hypothetical protein
MNYGGKTQIPPNLVVKYQVLDIVEVISSLIWRTNIIQTLVETGNGGVGRFHRRRPIGLPRNRVECGKTYSKLVRMGSKGC